MTVTVAAGWVPRGGHYILYRQVSCTFIPSLSIMVRVDSSAMVVSPGGSITVTSIGNVMLPCSPILLSTKEISPHPLTSSAGMDTSKVVGVRLTPSGEEEDNNSLFSILEHC